MPASKQKTILVSPLNWGLGHATRLIPIINVLIKKGNTVIIGAYGGSAALLKSEFPQCEHIELKGFNPSYSKNHSQSLTLLLQSISFLICKIKEHRHTSRIVSEHNIDLIISDNRYGVWQKNIPSIIITHQLSPELSNNYKWLRKVVSFFISSWVNKFNRCWIPDIPVTPNLSGTLSSNTFNLNNVTSTGLLSRFHACPTKSNYTIDNLAIISGPEPWRALFEKDIINLFKKIPGKSIVVRGLPENKISENITDTNIAIYNHCDTRMLNKLICSSRNIICRSGYSSLMDLFATGRRALLIPTPGQPEQEHLAKQMACYHKFITIPQQYLKTTDVSVFNNYDKQFTPFVNNILDILINSILK